MLSKEEKKELARLVDVKDKLDDDMESWKKRAKEFNSDIKKLIGTDKIDWGQLVKMLCEESNEN